MTWVKMFFTDKKRTSVKVIKPTIIGKVNKLINKFTKPSFVK